MTTHTSWQRVALPREFFLHTESYVMAFLIAFGVVAVGLFIVYAETQYQHQTMNRAPLIRAFGSLLATAGGLVLLGYLVGK